MNTEYSPEVKGIVDDIIAKYLAFIDDNKLKDIIFKRIKEEYNKGLLEGEVKFDMNFTPNYRTLSFLQQFGFDNVKKLSVDMKDELRKQVSMGLMNKETLPYLTKRVQLVLDSTIERARMITLTESNRANNMGHYQAATESGFDLVKEWSAQLERISKNGNMVPCPKCEEMDGRRVEMDEKFVFSDGEEVFLAPRHPNCACRVLYVQRADIKAREEVEFNGMMGHWVTMRGHHVFISKDGKMYTGDGKEFNVNDDKHNDKEEKKSPEREASKKKVKQLSEENKEKFKPQTSNAYSKVPQELLDKVEENRKLQSEGKDTEGLHSHKWGDRRVYSKERIMGVHKPIIRKYTKLFKEAKSDIAKVVFLAGIPAAGKTFATRNMFDFDESGVIATHKESGEKYIILNPDNFKKDLPEYDKVNHGVGAGLVHEESSHLNKHLMKHARKHKVNVIVDATIGDYSKAKKLLGSFHEDGYNSKLIHVTAPIEQAIESALSRFLKPEGRLVFFENIPGSEPGILDAVEKLRDEFHSHITVNNTRESGKK